MDSPQQSLASNRHTFVLLLLGYFLLILYPILSADRFCNDDLLRVLRGAYQWNVNGRPLTTLLMRALGLNLHSLVDFAPLPQILAIALLAFAGVLITRRYKVHSSLLAMLLALPLGAQPFFLENLSFRFDAPAMALAVLLAVLPIAVFRDNRSGFWLGALSLLGCLGTYQPAFNVFLIFVVLDLIAEQGRRIDPRRLGWLACRYAAQAMLAATVYQWTIAPSIKDWVREHSQTIHGIHQAGVIVDNAKLFGNFLLDAMPHRWMIILVPLMMISAIAAVFMGLRYALGPTAVRARPLWVTVCLVIFAILTPIIAVVFLAGPMLMLISPVVMPRIFPSVGALISASLIVLYLATGGAQNQRTAYVTFACAGIWALSTAVFAGVYGNALRAQQEYENRIASQLSDDLAELKAKDGVTQFLLDGSAGYSPLTEHAAQDFHLIHALVLPYLREKDFNSRNFMKLYGNDMDEMRQNSSDAQAGTLLTRACNTAPLYTRSRYTLRLVGSTAVVTFPGGLPASCLN